MPERLKQPRAQVSNCSTIGGETSTLIIVKECATPKMKKVAKKRSDSDVDDSRGGGDNDVENSKKGGQQQRRVR